MSEPFRMTIQDVFYFGDGMTVFAGEVLDGPGYIRPGRFEVSVNGRVIGCVVLDGERSLGRVPGVRSVGTSAEPPFDCDALIGREVDFAVCVPA